MQDPQLIAVWIIVAVAAIFLARSALKYALGMKGKCGGCGCAAGKQDIREEPSMTFVPADEVVIRRR